MSNTCSFMEGYALPQLFNVDHYTLDRIPQYRLDHINMRIKWLKSIYNLTENNWPLDCTHLLQKMKASQSVPFTYGFSYLPDNYEAITEYLCEYGLYLMHINRSKVRYPFETSADRRLNFTLAHEIGHMMLDHLKVPRDLKSSIEIEMEENEANEFAGRLLMPDYMLYTCNYYSLDAVAQYFIVSKTALWMRLNNMKRLNLLSSRRIRSCTCCGNTSFSAFAEYCGICGRPIRSGLRGIRRILYPQEIILDILKRVLSCPVCNSTITSTGDRCGRCGTYIFNYCSSHSENNIADNCSFANMGNSRYCEMCGKETYYYWLGLLRPWDDDCCGNDYVAEDEAKYYYK
jgi:Zn-dependent peptidase ImmA (M78 family)